MATKPKKTPTKKKPEAATPLARDGGVEISCYRGAIEAMDTAANCIGGIKASRRDPELNRAIVQFVEARPQILNRLNRVIERKG